MSHSNHQLNTSLNYKRRSCFQITFPWLYQPSRLLTPCSLPALHPRFDASYSANSLGITFFPVQFPYSSSVPKYSENTSFSTASSLITSAVVLSDLCEFFLLAVRSYHHQNLPLVHTALENANSSELF